MTLDSDLIRTFVRDQSNDAFAELVRRHLDIVYRFALSRVGGDVHAAQDVTQNVFVDLARKAPKLQDRTSLTPWLFTSTRYAAAMKVRAERRRRIHEEEAQTMQELHSQPAIAWQQLEPVLNDALDSLSEADRSAVLLRFFERQSLADLGRAFAISEDAARMRVNRALDHMRRSLSRHGISSTSTALAMALACPPAISAPAGLSEKVMPSTSTALASTVSASSSNTTSILTVMSTNKTILTIVGTAALIAIGTFVILTSRKNSQPASNPQMAVDNSSSDQEPLGTSLEPEESIAPSPVDLVSLPADNAALAPWDFSQAIVAIRQMDANMGKSPPSLARSIQEQRLRESSVRNDLGVDSETKVSLPTELAALSDTESALSYFRTLSSESRRSALFQLELADISSPDQRQMLAEALFQIWTEEDPAAAISAAGTRWATTAASAWAKINLTGAWSWANTADPSRRSSLRQAIIRTASTDQIETISNWVTDQITQSPPRDSYDGTSNILVQTWIKSDPVAAALWVNELANSYPDRAIPALSSLGYSARFLSPEQFDSIMEIQDDSNRDAVLEGAVGSWVTNSQLDRVQQYLASHPEMPDDRQDLILSTFGNAIHRDFPEIAFEAIVAIRDVSIRDNALHEAARQSAFQLKDGAMQPVLSPSVGMRYALAIENKELQADAVLQNFYWWNKFDPETARDFIEGSDFPPDFRAGLLDLGL